ncbi:methyl-accepting chemotaxis protein [Argonema antarcticum]|uniref:methyl-accepting chemotaxis protein n=1 Tax=Argonema antarcticum TaxID=2942763 RepID=UPI002012CB8C|nr:methyl-accepting chemotaxis protein [Argonema antarcticum]MCL1470003.1 methyl-accepting chemotaxis protein [Argonema antarcticum A004/B2]
MVGSKESLSPTLLKFRLRTALVVPFVLQIAATVGLVGYLSFRNGQEAVNKLARQVRMEVASRTELVIESYFKEPHQITRSNINALRLNKINFNDKEAVERDFFSQLQVYPLIGEIYVGTPDGSIIYVARIADGSFIANTTTNFPRREQYKLDNQGRRLNLLKVNNYDARIRPWYKVAIEKRGQSWTDVYLFATTQTLGIEAVEPYYDDRGKLVAIFSSNLPLKALSNFLKAVKVSQTGQTFVIDRAGRLAATSTGENPFVEVRGEKQQIEAVDSQNLLTRKTAEYLQKQVSNFSQITNLRELSFDIDGKRQYVLVQPYSDKKGLDFLVVVVVPEADFMAQINANTQTTIWLCLLALGLAIVVAIVTANWISSPILRIAKASEDLAGGNFEQEVASSQMIEIARLANSFNKMARQLQDSFDKITSVIFQADRVSNQISSSTSQIATANKQLEASAVHQATSTNEVRVTANQIASTSGQLVKTMENIAQKATATELAASSGQKSLTEMADAMDRLSEATNSIASRLGEMNEKANKINSVVITIAKVADQTNLLSLNAAIEAEKAGEAGTGFAVVAREVRRLADNSAAASQEIEEMVKEIQSSVYKGVMEMDKFSKQVSYYVEQVGRISGQIAEVIEQVQSLTPQFKQISHSMEGQFEGAQQISTAIAQLSEASQQTVASLQKTNRVLDELNDTAQTLQGIVSSKVVF